MKPVDPRLLRHARATRVFLVASVVLGLAGACLVIGQAMLIAEIVVGAYQEAASAADLRDPLLLLAAVSAGRALVSWLTELAAHRCSAAVKSELRNRLLAHAARLGPNWLSGKRTGELTALATRGIDALDDYFARYLPQLGLAVVVPVAVLARVVTEDWISAAIIVVTLPLIPLFMILIGWATQSRMDRQWRLLARLSGHFLDVVAGLPTLKVFGRAKAQAENIRAITDDYRRATLRTLRIAFLSSFALELLATISVALVAVTIGMRLVHGELDLYTGLVVLILAPEAYLPLRQVGAQYHAAAEGLSAAEEVFAVLETEAPARGGAPAPDVRSRDIALDRVRVRYEGRTHDALPETSLRLAPGETVALVGPSGAGKSTLLMALLGFTPLASGRVLAEADGDGGGDGTDLAGVDLATWHEQIAWVPQHPHLFAGTVADNVRLARPDAGDEEVRRALRDASAPELDPGTVLGEGGSGLSAGQRQRVALARAFLADRPLLLLDEPTAALDGETEAAVVDAVRRLAEHRTVLLVAHRPALLAVADRVVRLGAPPEAGAAVPRPGPEPRWVDAVAHGDTPVTGSGGSGGSGEAGGAVPVPVPAQVQVQVPVPVRAPEGEAAHGSGDRGEVATGGAAQGRALARVRRFARPLRARFALALLLGALALGSAVGLMATSGWLISRASEQPPVLYLMVAVTATRAFGIGRAVFRYAERLVSHDAVLRVLADLRVAVYRRLERLAPAGLRRTRRGDLLSRLVGDVDALQDSFLRWLLPAAVAVTVSAGAVGFTAWLLPEAGAALAAGLLVAGLAVPALTGAVSRRTERRLAPARGELSTRTVDLLTGTGELTVAGALPSRTREVREADAALTRVATRSAAATALAAGLTSLAAGLTVTAAAWAGAQAVFDGRLAGVCLAVVVLTPLAAFEAVNGLPLAVQFRQRTKRSAERVFEVLDAPEPVREPDAAGQSGPVGGPAAVRGPVSGRVAEPVREPGAVGTSDSVGCPGAVGESVPGRAPEPGREPAPAGEPASGRASGPVRGSALVGQPDPGREPEGERGPGSVREPGAVGEFVPAGRPGPVQGSDGVGAVPGSPFPLSVRALSVRHPGQEGRAALEGFELDLVAGRRVAVVGVSGSGKTTLAQALLRFVELESGSYTLAGVPAAALPSDEVRRHVGLCAQDAHLFDSTLRENLRLARTDASDADLRGALARARLDGWVATLPDGLDTLVGEHGARLSGGQRQRLALARALLADFPVLVLDEPAEHLDLPTADALTADLLAVTEGRTTVLITHRLHGLEAVDEVIVLDGGRTVERGPYAELAGGDGPFRRMLEREAATDGLLGAGSGSGSGNGSARAALPV
ncbi:thiol reductant ABC exporter subunit CydD [Streptomyces sp. NPDC054796]